MSTEAGNWRVGKGVRKEQSLVWENQAELGVEAHKVILALGH